MRNTILQKHTGQPLEKIERDTDRDTFMTAQEARDYGLVDHVLARLSSRRLIQRCKS